MIFIYYLILLLFNIKTYIYLTTIFQQNHYDYKKYIKSFPKYYLNKRYMYLYYISYLLLIFLFISKYFIIPSICILLISFVYKNKYIIKLRYTKRIIRLSITSSIIYLLIFLFTYKYIYVLSLYPVILPFILIFTNIINKPIELLINRYYYQKAKNKLLNTNIYKIAITGSFGKTSTKDIINSILSNNYVTLKTPASYNTLMGLSYTINNNNLKTQDFLILEMGAFRKKEIKQMTNLFKPNLRIITEIGMQHMSTFKTLSNVVDAKFEITSNIDNNDILVLNYENEYIRNYNISNLNQNNIYTYGINYGMIQAKNIKYVLNKLSFDIYINNIYELSINTNLLSKSNIMNILSTYTAIYALNKIGYIISNETFTNIISNLTPSPHRMEYKQVNNINIFDDSYSSNITGFNNACDVIKEQDGLKIIITPGIVDGGIYDKVLNEKVSKFIINTFDEIYLINNKSSLIIEEVLKQNNKSYYKYNNFVDAYNNILSKYQDSSTIVNLLIENDLPDSFLSR